jgi:hypothetical protein
MQMTSKFRNALNAAMIKMKTETLCELAKLEVDWTGKPCVVVGGGPSLRGFNWSKLEGLRTIGCNFSCPNPTITISHDANFVRPAPRGQLEEWRKIGGVHVHVNRQLQKEVEGVVFVNHLTEYSADWRFGLYAGSNCGIAAINLADTLRSNCVYLIGFDMHGENGLSANWHDKYVRKSNESIYERFLSDVVAIENKITTKVINLTPMTRLECFEKASPSILEAINRD